MQAARLGAAVRTGDAGRSVRVGVSKPGGLGLPGPTLVVARLDGVCPAPAAAHPPALRARPADVLLSSDNGVTPAREVAAATSRPRDRPPARPRRSRRRAPAAPAPLLRLPGSPSLFPFPTSPRAPLWPNRARLPHPPPPSLSTQEWAAAQEPCLEVRGGRDVRVPRGSTLLTQILKFQVSGPSILLFPHLPHPSIIHLTAYPPIHPPTFIHPLTLPASFLALSILGKTEKFRGKKSPKLCVHLFQEQWSWGAVWSFGHQEAVDSWSPGFLREKREKGLTFSLRLRLLTPPITLFSFSTLQPSELCLQICRGSPGT